MDEDAFLYIERVPLVSGKISGKSPILRVQKYCKFPERKQKKDQLTCNFSYVTIEIRR